MFGLGMGENGTNKRVPAQWVPHGNPGSVIIVQSSVWASTGEVPHLERFPHQIPVSLSAVRHDESCQSLAPSCRPSVEHPGTPRHPTEAL